MSVNDIARQLPVTRRTLDRRFADAVGHSVLEEINTCRLSRAKRLLKATDLPVKIVATPGWLLECRTHAGCLCRTRTDAAVGVST